MNSLQSPAKAADIRYPPFAGQNLELWTEVSLRECKVTCRCDVDEGSTSLGSVLSLCVGSFVS